MRVSFLKYEIWSLPCGFNLRVKSSNLIITQYNLCSVFTAQSGLNTALHPHTSRVNQLHFLLSWHLQPDRDVKIRLHSEAVNCHRFVTPQVLSCCQERLVSCSVCSVVKPAILCSEHDLDFQRAADPEHLCYWWAHFPWSGSPIFNSSLWALTVKAFVLLLDQNRDWFESWNNVGVLPIFCPRYFAVDIPVSSHFHDLKIGHFRHFLCKNWAKLFSRWTFKIRNFTLECQSCV